MCPCAGCCVEDGWAAATPFVADSDLPTTSGWITIPAPPGHGEAVPLRCWWARPAHVPAPAGAVLVLPEVFGVNGWVRSVADRLAAEGFSALALPLFSRTAPGLELGYSDLELQEGRSHKERTTASQLLVDVGLAGEWLARRQTQHDGGPAVGLGCVGFCFGGHVALLAATLPAVTATCGFYGAGVVSGRPGGGPPTLDGVGEINGRLLVVCGRDDALIPASDRQAIAAALDSANRQRPQDQAHRLITLDGGHGFMCASRADHHPSSEKEGWRRMLEWLRGSAD